MNYTAHDATRMTQMVRDEMIARQKKLDEERDAEGKKIAEPLIPQIETKIKEAIKIGSNYCLFPLPSNSNPSTVKALTQILRSNGYRVGGSYGYSSMSFWTCWMSKKIYYLEIGWEKRLDIK